VPLGEEIPVERGRHGGTPYGIVILPLLTRLPWE